MLSCEFWETVKNTIFTEHLGTPASVFKEHHKTECLFQPFETLINIEMYTCEIKITWHEKLFSFFSSDSVIFIIKCG